MRNRKYPIQLREDPSSKSNFCTNCGNIIDKDDDFCTNCGNISLVDKDSSIAKIEKTEPVIEDTWRKNRITKNIFTFYLNDEYENKWWHRLTKVLIYGSTIVIFIFSVIFFANDIWAWSIPNSKYIYSFEKNYSSTLWLPKKCTFDVPNNIISLMIDCGDISEKSYNGEYYFLPDFLNRYSKSKQYREEFLANEIDPECESNLSPTILRYCYQLNVNYNSLNNAIEQGHFDNIKVKRVLVTPILKTIGVLLLPTLIWFFILKSIIYRTLLYVVLGNKKI